jgi:hypothetical protein
MKLVCVRCEKQYRIKKNGVLVVDMFQDPPEPYEIREGDMWECPSCGHQVRRRIRAVASCGTLRARKDATLAEPGRARESSSQQLRTMNLREIKVGDVLRAPSGRLRIVRKLGSTQKGLRGRYVYFCIAHCSWTHRPYTLYTTSELERMGYRKVNHISLKSQFDRLLEEEMDTNDKPKMKCCDVMGIP